MARVGVRELRNRLSQYLKRVKAGEQVVVTERNKVIAFLIPPESVEVREDLNTLLKRGVASWAGGKPQGTARPIVIRGRSVADAVLEDRA